MISIKTLLRVFNVAFYAAVIVIVLCSVLSALLQRPLLFSAIKSNSMYPLMQRGDLVLVLPVIDGKACKQGDIILFSAQEGPMKQLGWISHRIVGGGVAGGFITKGDANELTDQANNTAANVQPEWISGKVIPIGDGVLKIPLIGFLPLFMEDFKDMPFMLPAVAVLLAVIIGLSELAGRKQKKNVKLSYPAIYFTGGLILTIILGASMLMLSQHIGLKYSVGDTGASSGGADALVYPVGERNTIKLADLTNRSFIPTIAAITSGDRQLIFSNDKMVLSGNDPVKTTVTISADKPGTYNSTIHIGIFYPLLPMSFIYALAKLNYWLALVVISLIPGLPLMAYPLIDSRMRAIVAKSFRKLISRFAV